MKRLTEIDARVKMDRKLNKEDLVFLYEIDLKIEGFGYERDPRIAEIREGRNTEEDMQIIFECTKEQIAHNTDELNENTKTYVGEFSVDILNKGIEHIYTTFPEGKIQTYNLEIGGKSKEEVVQELKENNINISDYAKDMLEKVEFSATKENANLVRLRVEGLGFPNGATTDEIYAKAEELGLELCPAETGPLLRLDLDQALGEYYRIAMKQITDRDGDPGVFDLSRGEDGLWLGRSWVEPGRWWIADNCFVFRFRKLES